MPSWRASAGGLAVHWGMPSASKPAPSSKSAAPSLRFTHSVALREQTLAVLAAVEGAEDALEHREALADLVVTLTHTGLDAYFMAPLKAAGAGFMLQQSANLGMAGAQQVMGSVIRNLVGRMDDPQLRSVCASLRGFMA